jgi:hypothetical protein
MFFKMMNRIFLVSILVIVLTTCVKISFAQSVKASISSGIKFGEAATFNSHATLGVDAENISGMHGITYKLSFDPEVIYADSLRISANSEQLGLKKNEYFEMQRIDSSYVLYSLTIKGRDKSLKLDELPISIDFVIKPETHYQLIANNCEYAIEFKAESVTAYDRNKSEIELSPFILPIEIECEEKGETQFLVAAPNPTLERCWIHIPPDKIDSIDLILLFDTKGQQQDADAKSLGDEIEVNLSHLKAGHYYLNIIYSNQKKDVVKIVKL